MSTVTVSDLNINFLPLIYDIIRNIEKETHDSTTPKSNIGILNSGTASTTTTNSSSSSGNAASIIIGSGGSSSALSQQQQSSSDINAKMQQIRELFAQFRDRVPRVPGIGATIDDQYATLTALRQQLVMKRELLLKYKRDDTFAALARSRTLLPLFDDKIPDEEESLLAALNQNQDDAATSNNNSNNNNNSSNNNNNSGVGVNNNSGNNNNNNNNLFI